MTVRTAVLAFGTQSVGSAVASVYTCPQGRTAILKHVILSKTIGEDTYIAFGVGSGAGNYWLLNRTVVTGTNNVSLDAWIVLEPGHQLRIQVPNGGAVNFWASGTELAGVAP